MNVWGRKKKSNGFFFRVPNSSPVTLQRQGEQAPGAVTLNGYTKSEYAFHSVDHKLSFDKEGVVPMSFQRLTLPKGDPVTVLGIKEINRFLR